jgi:hypothetical protein
MMEMLWWGLTKIEDMLAIGLELLWVPKRVAMMENKVVGIDDDGGYVGDWVGVAVGGHDGEMIGMDDNGGYDADWVGVAVGTEVSGHDGKW